jgi:hypothetical protein
MAYDYDNLAAVCANLSLILVLAFLLHIVFVKAARQSEMN